MDLKAIEKKIGKAIPHHHADKYAGVDPHAQWKILFLSFVALTVLIVIWSAYMFLEIKSGGIFTTTPDQTTSSPVIDRTKIDSIVSRFDSKASHTEALKNAPPTYSDPGR